MRPFYICCIFLLFVLIIVITTITDTINSEKYVLLRNVGSFPKRQLIIKKHNKIKTDSNQKQSTKYTGHRYDRHHVRYNPHTRNYIHYQ